MSTHLSGFQSFFKVLHHFVMMIYKPPAVYRVKRPAVLNSPLSPMNCILVSVDQLMK